MTPISPKLSSLGRLTYLIGFTLLGLQAFSCSAHYHEALEKSREKARLALRSGCPSCAREEYEKALQLSIDQEEKESLELARCETWSEEEKHEQAARCYETWSHGSPAPERAPQGWLRAARSWMRADKQSNAKESFKIILHRYPDASAASQAFHGLLSFFEQEQKDLCLETGQLIEEDWPTKLLEEAYFAKGLACEPSAPQSAISAYRHLLLLKGGRRFGREGDAKVHLAKLLRRQDLSDDALKELKPLLKKPPSAWGPGNYSSVAYEQAHLLALIIYSDELGNVQKSEKILRKMVKRFPDSRLLDDAIYYFATLPGSRKGCQWIETLGSLRPDSRYLKCSEANCQNDLNRGVTLQKCGAPRGQDWVFFEASEPHRRAQELAPE
ncbi:MAG: hypothetical protein MK135_07035 [Polyangiaceae bacterium]|nr:hypothetical protein [Polyangiaceae bacterium]